MGGAIVVLAVLCGCSSGHSVPPRAGPHNERPTTPVSPSSQAASPTSTGPSAPVTTAAPIAGPVAWTACSGHPGWQCGTLQVPLDYAHPGPTIGIALNRHPATDPANRVGSLLLNPGGPGASGLEFAYDAVDDLLDPVLLSDFDIIGFDPRGVGQSDPVECVDGPTLDQLNHLPPAPSTPADLAAVEAGVKQLDAGCEARSGTLLPHVSTADAARDMDSIRAAVGDAKLTYLGFSYGTLLGATYASLFPTHVRALTLDGAIDPSLSDGAIALAQAAGFQADFDDFLADCASQGSSCPFHTDGAPSLQAAFDTLMAKIAADPLPGAGGRTVGAGEAFTAVIAPLYDRGQWSTLAQELGDAQAGHGALMLAENDTYLERSGNGTYANEEVADTAVSCVDQPGLTVSGYQSLAAEAAKVSSYFGPPLAWGTFPCAYWPVPAEGAAGPLHAPGAPPILVVGSTGDPVTPYAWAEALAAQLGSGVLVTRHGDGHAAYPYSACTRSIEDAYLVSLTVPSATAADCPS
jgi:pimeloyl-ACP methyl ester carboxylesterase